MKRSFILLATASLLIWGCGGDDDGGGGETQSELADLMLEDSAGLVDEACVRDKADELSDDDAQFLIDNFDATDTSGFDPELESWVNSLIECIDLDAQGG